MLSRRRAQLDEARRRVSRIVNFVSLGRAENSKALAKQRGIGGVVKCHSRRRWRTWSRAPTRACAFPRGPGSRSAWRNCANCSSGARRPPGSCCVGSLGGWCSNPCTTEQGAPVYIARTALDVLVPLEPLDSDPGSESRANSLGSWTCRGLNPYPMRRRIPTANVAGLDYGPDPSTGCTGSRRSRSPSACPCSRCCSPGDRRREPAVSRFDLSARYLRGSRCAPPQGRSWATPRPAPGRRRSRAASRSQARHTTRRRCSWISTRRGRRRYGATCARRTPRS